MKNNKSNETARRVKQKAKPIETQPNQNKTRTTTTKKKTKRTKRIESFWSATIQPKLRYVYFTLLQPSETGEKREKNIYIFFILQNKTKIKRKRSKKTHAVGGLMVCCFSAFCTFTISILGPVVLHHGVWHSALSVCVSGNWLGLMRLAIHNIFETKCD